MRKYLSYLLCVNAEGFFKTKHLVEQYTTSSLVSYILKDSKYKHILVTLMKIQCCFEKSTISTKIKFDYCSWCPLILPLSPCTPRRCRRRRCRRRWPTTPRTTSRTWSTSTSRSESSSSGQRSALCCLTNVQTDKSSKLIVLPSIWFSALAIKISYDIWLDTLLAESIL